MNRVMARPVLYILFLLPALSLYIIFMGIPIVESFYYAFFQWDGVTESTFVGLDNFKELFADEVFYKSFANNLYFIAFSTLITLPFVIVISLLLSKIKKMMDFYRTGVFLPTILSTAVVGVIWLFIYHPEVGLLNNLFRSVGLDAFAQNWLSDPKWAMLGVLVANAWQWNGFYIVLILTAILNVPKEINESAEIDGANGWQKLWYITLPLIRPILVVVMLLSVAGSMKALDIVIVMTNGNPFQTTEVMATYMFTKAFREYQYGYGSAVAVVIFLITLIFTWIIQLLAKKGEDYEY
ncbi:carbohydrate ABC transporter permease [Brevibacillus dissolubilis]|uniref:carbohydrate ABC transporter permease n=1 Tax=Brevibacillus dissolubilis TaxID=1844116 RepID=UPI001115C201|nr:sugar ABC transporter permease [Brevibacillus dissolubilis]